MSLKSLIKVTDYYNVKYGFGKVASSSKMEDLFEKYDRIIVGIENKSEKLLNSYVAEELNEIYLIFNKHLPIDDIQLLFEYAVAVYHRVRAQYSTVFFDEKIFGENLKMFLEQEKHLRQRVDSLKNRLLTTGEWEESGGFRD